MKLFRILFSIVIILTALSCSDDTGTGSESGTITGTVLNAITQGPIGGASVVTDPPTESLITNQQGEFTLRNVSPGNYTIVFSKIGYNTKQIVVNVKANNTTDADVLLLPLGGDNLPPNPPVNPYPENNSTVLNSSVQLSWDCDDPNGDSLNYDVYFGKANPPTELIKSNLKSRSFFITTLDDSTTYYWSVIARDRWGSTTSSLVWKFNAKIEGSGPSPEDGLIAWWPFDGDALDKSGYNRHGTEENEYYYIDGIVGQAIRLVGNGSNEQNGGFVDIPFIDFSEFDEFTISLWVNFEYTTHFHGASYIDFGNWSYGWVGIMLQVDLPADQPEDFYINYSVGSKGIELLPLTSKFEEWERNNWILYTLVYSNGTISAYKNDLLVGTKKQSVHIYDDVSGISRGWSAYGTYSRLVGSIDDVRIYSRALKSNEVRALYLR